MIVKGMLYEIAYPKSDDKRVVLVLDIPNSNSLGESLVKCRDVRNNEELILNYAYFKPVEDPNERIYRLNKDEQINLLVESCLDFASSFKAMKKFCELNMGVTSDKPSKY